MKNLLFSLIGLLFLLNQVLAQSAEYGAVFGNFMQFTSANANYVNCSNHASIQINGALSIEAWINPATAADMSIVEKYSAPCTGGYALRMNPSRNIVVFSLGASNVCTPLISSGTVPLNQWSHVALTFDSGTLRVYINGVLNGTLSGQGTPNTSPNFLTIGRRGDNSSALYFNGLIDEVRIWNIARSATDLANAMNAPLAGNEANLVAYYNFNQSGQGAGLTLTNSSTSAQSGGAAIQGTTQGNASTPAFCSTAAALDFDGLNDFVEVNHNALSIPQLSLEAWVKPALRTDGTAYTNFPNNVISSDLPGGYGHGFGLNIVSGSSGICVEVNDAFRYIATPLVANTWYHVVCVYSPGNVKTYLNGTLLDDYSFTQGYMDANNYFYIGMHNYDAGYGSRRFFKGVIDEIRIWNKALSVTEVANLNLCTIPTTAGNLVANYHFNQGAASGSNSGITTLTDASGSNYSGTLNGFALHGTASNWVSDGAPLAGNCIFCTPTTGSSSASACGTYSWNNTTYTSSGTYSALFTNAAGCDSTHTLQLTLNPIPTVICSPIQQQIQPSSICLGDSALINSFCGCNQNIGFVGANNYTTWTYAPLYNATNFNNNGGTQILLTTGGSEPFISMTKTITCNGNVEFDWYYFVNTGILQAFYSIAGGPDIPFDAGNAQSGHLVIPMLAGQTLSIKLQNVGSGSLMITNYTDIYTPYLMDWYTSPTGGNPIGSGQTLWVLPQSTGYQNYYAEFRDPLTNCISPQRIGINTPLLVNSLPVPAAITASSDTLCLGSSADLNYQACQSNNGFNGYYARGNWTYTPVYNNSDFDSLGYYGAGPDPIIKIQNANASISRIMPCSGEVQLQWVFPGLVTPIFNLLKPQVSINGVPYPLPTLSYTQQFGAGIFYVSNTINISVQAGQLLEIQAVYNPLNGSPYPNPNFMGVHLLFAPYTLPHTVNWYDASIGGNLLGSGHAFSVTPASPGIYTYYAQVQDANTGCTNPMRAASIPVTVNPLPVVNTISTPDTTICLGDSVMLMASSCSAIPGFNGSNQFSNWQFSPDTNTIAYANYFTPSSNANSPGNELIFNIPAGPFGQQYAKISKVVSCTGPYIIYLNNLNVFGQLPAFRYRINGVSTDVTFNYQPSISYYAFDTIQVQAGDTLEFELHGDYNYNVMGPLRMQLVSAPSENTITWYDAAQGGTMLASGSILSVLPGNTGSYNYFVEVQDANTGCVNPIRAVSDTIVVSSCNLQLHLTLLLQGYYSGLHTMGNILMNQGVPGALTGLVDTVNIELHAPYSPYELVESYQGVLNSNGQISGQFSGDVIGQSFYLVVRHRNHLETWSDSAVLLSQNSSYDFSILANQAFGNNQYEAEPNIFAIYTGDINQDGVVDGLDYNDWELDNNNFSSGYLATDLNGDGIVDGLDFLFWETNNIGFVGTMRP